MQDVTKHINLDLVREDRIGFDEAIFCEQKTAAQIDEILHKGQESDIPLLLTRLKANVWGTLTQHWGESVDYEEMSQTGFFNYSSRRNTRKPIAVVTAGSSDVPVAREAVRTLAYYGIESNEFYDVGVAGLWRLLDRLDDIRQHPVVIAVAGMDAALPSVIGGLVGSLIIAVPTSTGYGAAQNGLTALNSSLVSCAPGVLVCNIDNGYGAACAALRATSSFSN